MVITSSNERRISEALSPVTRNIADLKPEKAFIWIYFGTKSDPNFKAFRKTSNFNKSSHGFTCWVGLFWKEAAGPCDHMAPIRLIFVALVSETLLNRWRPEKIMKMSAKWQIARTTFMNEDVQKNLHNIHSIGLHIESHMPVLQVLSFDTNFDRNSWIHDLIATDRKRWLGCVRQYWSNARWSSHSLY
jgi:hypothetical protein